MKINVTSVKVPFNPELSGKVILKGQKHGVILAHGVNSDPNSGIILALAKKLSEADISSFRFNFPFREMKTSKIDEINVLDQAYLAAWNFVTEKYNQIDWVLGGFDLGAETAIRISGLIFDSDGIPPVISINYPMYPPNKPELVNTNSLGALMGEGLFVQAENSNKGTFDRLKNQIQMMAPHAHLSRIGKANQAMEVPDKPLSRVAFWISRDIVKFFKNLN